MQFCKDHSAELKTVVGLLGIAFGMVKLSQFNTGLTDAISNIGGCIQTIGTMIGVTGAQAAATGAATTAQTGLNIAMNANPIGVIILAVEALIAVWLLFGDKLRPQRRSSGKSLRMSASKSALPFPVRLIRLKTPLRRLWNGRRQAVVAQRQD